MFWNGDKYNYSGFYIDVNAKLFGIYQQKLLNIIIKFISGPWRN